ncbi:MULTISPECIES: amino acid ABC transporter permease [unclassified Brevibacterium]|uniref:amino acid ABC transporter permease n=1 Tax=unclassified Brevibacterium TaxID=2614124 RepID=UPI001092A285|nr:amino acid ABC transporter permease [Brevibacterium sp. S22]TGD32646.1 amino acid ABC transporter permease [Brevibacterium sp. S22]
MQYVSDLLPGLATTFSLWLFILAIGVPGGIVFGYLLRYGHSVVKIFILVLTNFGRGFPGLAVVYLVYTGMPGVGILLSGFQAVVIALGFMTVAYTAEIFRSAIHKVPQSQTEAAMALGLSFWKTQIKIILPQALRSVLPSLLAFSVLVLQATALGYAVGLRELTGLSYNFGSITFQALPYMVAAGVIYLAGCLCISTFASRLKLEYRRPKGRSRRVDRASASASIASNA